MNAWIFIVPAIVAIAFVAGAAAGVKWVTDVWFAFLDEVMGEMEASELIAKFENWRPRK